MLSFASTRTIMHMELTFMENKIKINENERKVLSVLTREGWSEGQAYYFRGLVDATNLGLKEVRRACRSLNKKGLAEYVRGLFDDDGKVAGSGYACTQKGCALISPCDLCGQEAMFEYDGKKECREHYEKSNVQPKLI